jgi:SAM-dependent methyltransferase
MLERLTRFIGKAKSAPETVADAPAPELADPARKKHRRLLADAGERMESYIGAARDYPSRIPKTNYSWLYMKPFEWAPGHKGYFYDMHNALGLLRAMKICPGGDILEIGCGPGWLTEILLMLGYRVTALDPSSDLVDIARHRVENASVHYRMPIIKERARFFIGTLEDYNFSEAEFDAIIFYDVLHHIVDEERGLANCAKWLRPGGVLGIIEGAWIPGDAAQEKALFEEMATYGTMENPFTQQYLEELLQKVGFENIERLLGVSGMYPISRKEESLAQNAFENPVARNDLIAQKSPNGFRYSNDPEAKTAIKLQIDGVQVLANNIQITARVENVGEAVLIGGTNRSGSISFALRKGELGSDSMVEGGRWPLPADLRPGESRAVSMSFSKPGESDGWHLDAIAEHIAWLSTKGFEAVPIDLVAEGVA